MYQENYFAVSVKINIFQRQTKCIDDQDKFQSFKDTGNEFTERQNSKENQLAPISWHFMHTRIYENFME